MEKSFTKIGDWRKQPEEYQKAVLCDGKLWFFGKKFLDQPTYHWGHHVAFAGAHSDFFDMARRQWSVEGAKPFPAVAVEEHLEELLFTQNSAIFLLLYSHFGPFLAHSLHQFDVGARQWRKLVDFPGRTAEIPPEESLKNALILVDGPSPNGGRFFVSYVDHQIRFHLLELGGDSAAVRWTDIGAEMPGEEAATPSRLQPTQAAYANGIIYVQGGVHGCGFRWQPNQLIKFRLSDQSTEMIHIGTDGDPRPPFSYMGPFAHAIVPSKHVWLHFAGNNADGMTGSAFNGQIWALANLEGDDVKWQKLGLEVPRPTAADGSVGHASDVHIVYAEEDGQLVVAQKEHGILTAKLIV